MGDWTLRLGTGIAAAVLLLLLVIQGAALTLFSGGGNPLAGCDVTDLATAGADSPDLTGEQTVNATTILTVAQQQQLPPRAAVIAIATALQESRLRNLDHGDRDSLGLFQQRPSQGWGDTPTGPSDHRTPEQRITDPTYAATAFYNRLKAIDGWQEMALTVAAQAVQNSGHPGAYAQWEPLAARTVAAVGSGSRRANPDDLEQLASNPGCLNDEGDGLPASASEVLPAGFALPKGTSPAVRSAIAWALRQLGTPYSYGGDCTAAQSGNPAHECDCSSLTQMAYQAGGIALPRTTSMQVRVGVPVHNVSQLRSGDLIFIPGSRGTLTAPRHVGLYLGEGLIVQAPRSGDRVKLSQLSVWAPISAVRRVVR